MRIKTKLKSATCGMMSRFRQDQDGAMSYVAVAGALVMMVFGGIGIDMIHAELKRNKVQNTLDRAVLAAASIDNTLDPEFVVQEYFRAMNMSDALGTVAVDQSLNYKRVTADGSMSMPSNFMSLLGVNTLEVEGLATAEHGLTKIEISLVLDVSGSMGGNKIEQLRSAAKEFIDLMLPAEDAGMVSISVIPYNATVNLGDTIAPYFTLDDTHDYSSCATFNTADFNSTAVDPSTELARLGHFDPYNSSTSGGEIASPWCQTGTTSAMMVHSSDAAALKAHIDTFNAGGNTAIDLGMKWGAALLDPAARPAVQAMSVAGLVSADHSSRPAAYNDTETLKFVVVMTDGQNTTQFDLKSHYKYGLSEAWVDTRGTETRSDDRYSMRVQDNAGDNNDVFYWLRMSGNPIGARYHNKPDGPANPNGDRVYQMTNAELYSRFSIASVASNFYYRPYADGYLPYSDYYDAYYGYEATVSGGQANSNLSTVCQAARNNGVVVYSIGVEAPQAGLDAMQDCASSPAHYFDVSGSDLSDTFSSIARSLQMLRLTQ
ncbi:von Willebrand factor type A domain protein [Pelagimonas phthalicica]|uniref:von Willebrand factor type A domain protein n=1 Tax=Pelagimonas phthalicica TaxID=1037362 RepID=A0A238JHY0_9RHOB|nr:TadE/TadG family type IV pilus assembly protein [Pelagimonas phthalicica]TDS90101.1 Flp pilus assembly protein TadG [Pelagimonas phthalicica]SMX30269.1 von Willebrand factor type A domain protein [Pelagimonas phthalicica]